MACFSSMLRGLVTPTRPHGSVVCGSSPAIAHRRRAEERRVDAVADKRRRQGDARRAVLHAADAICVKSPASIAARRHEPHVVRRPLVRLRPLVRAEEEQPVGDDRSAERAAELVALQAVVAPLAGRGIDGVERDWSR